MMSTIIRSIPLAISTSIPTELAIRYRIALLLHVLAIALLPIRTHARPRRLPSLAFARQRLVVGERSARGFGPLGVDVVESVDAAAGVLAADVKVETEGAEGGDAVSYC